jgi:hypothetical protein
LGILSKPKQQASKKKKERMVMVEGPVTERIHSIRRWWHSRAKRLWDIERVGFMRVLMRMDGTNAGTSQFTNVASKLLHTFFSRIICDVRISVINNTI